LRKPITTDVPSGLAAMLDVEAARFLRRADLRAGQRKAGQAWRGQQIATLALKKISAASWWYVLHRVRRGPGRAIFELAAMGLL
jgi:hypothetical protein